ncbi:MAG: hypothetical protein PHQ12_01175 [Chthoniobacteraceae bacterium]|nr:hypothetical protein [Chthoniobacteraceae bacterium]
MSPVQALPVDAPGAAPKKLPGDEAGKFDELLPQRPGENPAVAETPVAPGETNEEPRPPQKRKDANPADVSADTPPAVTYLPPPLPVAATVPETVPAASAPVAENTEGEGTPEIAAQRGSLLPAAIPFAGENSPGVLSQAAVSSAHPSPVEAPPSAPAKPPAIPLGQRRDPDGRAPVPSEEPWSGKIPPPALPGPPSAVQPKPSGSAKIAEDPAPPLPIAEATPADSGKTTAPGIIQSASGMSVAVEHAPMPTPRPQPVKDTPPPAAPPATAPGVSPAPVGAPQAAEPAAREQTRDGNGTPSGGSEAFGTFLPVARETPGAGNPQPEAAAKAGSPQDTAAILHHTLETAERMRSDGRGNVEIQVRLHDGQELTIQLRMNAGECQPVFKTESADLRAALEHHWSQFTSTSADRGLRIAAPVFETPQSGLGDFQQRQQHQPPSSFLPGDGLPRPARPKTAAAASRHPGASLPEERGAIALFA